MIGLEFNENYIKLVEVKAQPQGPLLTAFGIAPVELKSLEGDVDAVISAAIQKLAGQANFSDNDVYTLISGPMLQARRVSLPPMPEVDLAQAVKFEAHNFSTFPPQETVTDFFVIEKAEGKDSRKLDVMVLAIEKNALKRIPAIISRAGLRCAGVTIAPFALKELLPAQPSYVKEELTALLDLSLGSATLTLLKDGIVQFVREITLGDQLKAEIISSFTYYREQFFGEKIARLFVSGEIAMIEHLRETLAADLGIPIETIDPLRNIQLGPSLDTAKLNEEAPRLALAIGLAQNQARNLNLVKVKEKAQKKVRAKSAAALTTLSTLSIPSALVVGLLVLTVALILGINYYLSQAMEKTKKELQVKSLRLEQLTNFQERKLSYEEIRGKRIEVRTVLRQIAALLPPGTALAELSYDNPTRHFTLVGETTSPESVSAFIMKLDQSAEFEQVKLKEIKKAGTATVFSLDCDLKKGVGE